MVLGRTRRARRFHGATVSAARHRRTRTTASSTMRLDIFDWPAVRSVKVIGTSTTRRPWRAARQVFSTWKQ